MNSRRNRIGSNQYKVKRHKHVGYHLLVFLALMDLLATLYLFSLPYSGILSPYVSAQAIPEETSLITATKSAQLIPSPEYNQKDIEAYIHTIFGKDARTAIAVSHNECGYTNPKYPKCQLHTSHENSIGLFQINIESATTKIHWSRIPGETLDEKIKWLQNPYNNTLMAYWIFEHSGWNPWSAYTSGRYLADM